MKASTKKAIQDKAHAIASAKTWREMLAAVSDLQGDLKKLQPLLLAKHRAKVVAVNLDDCDLAGKEVESEQPTSKPDPGGKPPFAVPGMAGK